MRERNGLCGIQLPEKGGKKKDQPDNLSPIEKGEDCAPDRGGEKKKRETPPALRKRRQEIQRSPEEKRRRGNCRHAREEEEPVSVRKKGDSILEDLPLRRKKRVKSLGKRASAT